MVVIGGLLVLAGYGVGIYGWCQTRGYAVSFLEVWRASWPGGKNENTAAGTTGKSQATSPASAPGLGQGVA